MSWVSCIRFVIWMSPPALRVPENPGQFPSSPMEAGFHGPFRHSQDFGCVAYALAFHIYEDDGGAELLGYAGQGRGQVRTEFDRFDVRFGPGIGVVQSLGQGIGAAPRGPSQLVIAGVDCHPVEPGRELRVAAELVGLAEYGDEGVPGRVQGGFPVPENPQTDSECPILVTPRQLV